MDYDEIKVMAGAMAWFVCVMASWFVVAALFYVIFALATA